MKKYLAVLLAAVLCLGSLSGCGGKNGAQEQKEIKKIAYLCSNLGDKSFNDVAWEGVKKAGEEFGLEVKAVEYGADNKSRMEPTLQDAAGSYDMVIFSGNEMIEFLEKCYEDFPDTKFVAFDIDPVYELTMPNVFVVAYLQHQGEFLTGVLAQRLSASGVTGLVGGTEAVGINDFLVGYIQGVQYADPNAKVAISYVGGFTDSPKAKELAYLQMDQGADVLHQVAGGAGLGVFEACVDRGGARAIGVDADQRAYFLESNPKVADVIVTSMLKRNDVSLYNIIKDSLDGNIAFGPMEKWGVKQGATVLADNDYYRQTVPQPVRDEVQQVADQIASGAITVKTAYGMEQETFAQMRNAVKP